MVQQNCNASLYVNSSDGPLYGLDPRTPYNGPRGVCLPLASQSPYPIIVYAVANYRLHLSHFWENM